MLRVKYKKKPTVAFIVFVMIFAGLGSYLLLRSHAAPATCSTTLSPGANVAGTLQSAAGGSVVCLNSGSYSQVAINGMTPATTVTLQPAPGASVTMAGLTTAGTVNNLTVQGINFSASIGIFSQSDHITLKYNTIQNIPDGIAVFGDPHNQCNNCSLNNFDVEYNQIDHVKFCLAEAANSASNWTFSHNVCGPGIGYGASDNNSHYTQTECLDTMVMDNNAFLGPFDPGGLASGTGAHNNVSHSCGTNLQFDNNIVWHDQSRAQTVLWGDDGTVNTAEANNNLFVEYTPDTPSCGGASTDCPTYSLALDTYAGGGCSSNCASNVTMSNNTILANHWGGIYAWGTNSGRTTNIAGLSVQNNIAVSNVGGGGYYIDQPGNCTCGSNVSDDGSAPGSGGVKTWTTGGSWQNTTWTPNTGEPWNPPPANYYKPNLTGGVTASMGYQGSIGPGAAGSVGASAFSNGVTAPTVNLSASPTTISSGGSSTLAWTSSNATSCVATSPASWTAKSTTNDSQLVSNITSTTTYTISCTNGSTSTQASATVTVSASNPPVASFTYSPANPVVGSPVHFDGTGSSCTHTPCTYTWHDINDPVGTNLGTGVTLDFTFQGVGSKPIQLTVTDSLGSSNTSATQTLNVAASSGVIGDLDNNGHVNVFDLSILLSHWNQIGSGISGDLNNDNIVNIFDLSMLLSHYGT